MSDDQKPRRDWESSIEKQIRQAMENGEFENLRGRGKPLDLGENPFTPEDWRMAFKVLKDAGVAPEWIEQGKEVRQALSKLEKWIEAQSRWQRERRAQMKTLAPDKMIAEYEHLAQTLEQSCAAYRQRAVDVNRTIDTFNLQVPNVNLQIPRLRIEEEIEKFCAACR